MSAADAEALETAFASLGPVRRRRFFGGQGFRCGKTQFALLMKGTLFLRCDAGMADELAAAGSEPFRYGTRRGEVEVRAYWSSPVEAGEDPDVLLAWARRALMAARR